MGSVWSRLPVQHYEDIHYPDDAVAYVMYMARPEADADDLVCRIVAAMTTGGVSEDCVRRIFGLQKSIADVHGMHAFAIHTLVYCIIHAESEARPTGIVYCKEPYTVVHQGILWATSKFGQTLLGILKSEFAAAYTYLIMPWYRR
jgi:hypothetical protein